ncbi:hypothetical protein PRNP1_004577 [Phytophthora ramorum]
MGKDRFVVNPFAEVTLSDGDKDGLKDFAYNFIDQNIEKYEAYIGNSGVKVDEKKWKLIKTKDDTKVFLERDPVIRTSKEGIKTDHPEFLMTGITWGTVDDCMFGAVNPSLESMRIKASYLEQRKVSFCGLCLQQVRTMSPLEVAREHAAGACKQVVSYARIDPSYASIMSD